VGGGGSIKFLLTFPTFKFSSTNRIGNMARLKGFVYKMFTRIKIFIFSMKSNNTSDK
jgi:hypothetical protein